ncbi:putative MFS family arabinose efflux permease [Dongia mobilis]|uniref:Putative MFS family arabinose efflux permease n=1 Tax=Dongia mobilis TaxID=578943 RepID=A0A4R6WMP1_9PROT|nr:MFS transporter [Dongia mobilis]TDQ82289.1 putative MFS family arabinose efflux permease [Dongia mobilis]
MTSAHALLDSPRAWTRLWAALGIAVMGGIGLWSPVVVLPVIEAEFGTGRGGASLPYTATMIGFALGGVLMGRFSDRFGIFRPVVFGTLLLGAGFVLASFSTSYWQFVAIQAGLIGFLGCSPTFGPLVADISHWFKRRRGIAIAIVASGNYLAGTIWPPVITHLVTTIGWRETYLSIGLLCLITMLPLALVLRQRLPEEPVSADGSRTAAALLPLPSPHLQSMLLLAGLACCVAMAMPQVHMIAYCGDLGYGPARGAEMLSLMLGFGVVSRLVSGLIADRIGGVGTLILGSGLQCLALFFYLPFDGLMSLYIVSALFGLSQGGIVPSYALIVRDYFPAREAGTRISLCLTATVVGMALGGWLSGLIFDWTGSYQAAFAHGIAWNFLNMGIAAWLLMSRRALRMAGA